jgi:hypothetical protein
MQVQTIFSLMLVKSKGGFEYEMRKKERQSDNPYEIFEHGKSQKACNEKDDPTLISIKAHEHILPSFPSLSLSLSLSLTHTHTHTYTHITLSSQFSKSQSSQPLSENA